ncbi:DMT family transporter [Kordiimonas laminariae]|uniref:DMT family transporter n=1 Tax=Kordiimonas laminariae TaxID=2917717 RepID=UPI001FF1A28B|nr:DMT family transporter [Kordiimonas laminariae]MCK0069267.1 DMT family transporter [Kordiimonas laminariae]
MTTDPQQMRKGMIMGAIATLIWGGWPVVTELAIEDNLSPYQVVLLRTLVAFPILLPFLFRGKNTIKAWGQVVCLTFLAGAPYSLLVSTSFQYTNATHGGVIIPGTVLLFGLLSSHFILKDRLTRNRLLGGCAIITGLGLLAFGGSSGGDQASLLGDALFFVGGLMWGTYTLMLRIWPTDAILLTARIALVSTFIMGAYYLVTNQPGLEVLPTRTIIFQGLWQGALSGALAVILFSKGVALMGAAKATVINSLIPVISTVLAFFILKEIPNMLEAIGLIFILGGITIALYVRKAKSAFEKS